MQSESQCKVLLKPTAFPLHLDTKLSVGVFLYKSSRPADGCPSLLPTAPRSAGSVVNCKRLLLCFSFKTPECACSKATRLLLTGQRGMGSGMLLMLGTLPHKGRLKVFPLAFIWVSSSNQERGKENKTKTLGEKKKKTTH